MNTLPVYAVYADATFHSMPRAVMLLGKMPTHCRIRTNSRTVLDAASALQLEAQLVEPDYRFAHAATVLLEAELGWAVRPHLATALTAGEGARNFLRIARSAGAVVVEEDNLWY